MVVLSSLTELYRCANYSIFMPRGGATAYGSRVVCVSVCPSVCLSVCPLDFLQDGTESAAENCNFSITREYLENDGLRFSI